MYLKVNLLHTNNGDYMSLINNLKKELEISKDYIFKELNISNKKIYLLFNEVLTNTLLIDDFIIRELVNLDKRDLKDLINILPNTNIIKINKKDIINFVNNGFLVIIGYEILAIEVRANLDRGVSSVESELSLTGPKDAFSEIFNTNLGLIRRRIKSPYLVSKTLSIGRSSKTLVGILYMKNLVNKKLVKDIENKLNKIDIDGIIDSSYLKNSLENKNNLFPTLTTTERPDKSSMALLEGKVVIIVDGSPYTIILPSFFIDFFHTVDDYYGKDINTTFIRIIRLIAFLIAIFLPSLYISVTTRNYDLIPYKLLIMLKAGRTFVPFPAYIEALFMIIAFEILKESDIRMSATTGSAISILGGLILGDAAVSAGIVSPIMIIIIAISSIAALIFPSNELVNVVRFYKIFLLILSAIFGIYGVFIGTFLLLYNLFTIRCFNYSYLSPIIPYDKNEILDSFIKKDKNIKTRNSLLTKNIIRGKYK